MPALLPNVLPKCGAPVTTRLGTVDAFHVGVRRALRVATALGLVTGCGGAPQTHAAGASEASGQRSECSAIQLRDGLDLVILGSGGPRSAGRAASSYVIAIDRKPRFMVDVGSGAFTRLGESGLSANQLDTFLLTHLHIDHVGDLADVVKSRDLSADASLTFRVYGPAGRGEYPSTSAFLDRLFGSEGAFAYLPGFRNELRLSASDLPTDVRDAPREILSEHGVKVSSVAVDHGDVPAVAYRIEYAGRSVVISGDLASKRGNIEALAPGASVLVYDAAVLDPPGSPEGLYRLHTPPSRIGEIAATAEVQTLILSHLAPASERREQEILTSVRATFRGEVRFAKDCMHVPLGAESREGS